MPENKLCLWSIRMEKGLGAEKLEATRQKSIFSVTIRKTFGTNTAHCLLSPPFLLFLTNKIHIFSLGHTYQQLQS